MFADTPRPILAGQNSRRFPAPPAPAPVTPVTGHPFDRGNIGTMPEFVNQGVALGLRAPVVRGRQQAVDLKWWRLQSAQPLIQTAQP